MHNTDSGSDSASGADKAIESLQRIDGKVDELRSQMMSDPDSLGDKLLKMAIPAVTGLVAGHLFQMVWDKGTNRLDAEEEAQQGLLMSIAFAAASAAFGAVVSTLSGRGSQALVDRRHRKRS
ncbi:hypothetical protein G1C94_1303 [Bifidobacterium sp. DSM 109963]|uniref:DUF4235 domain-containing protein n=2 Tax=Bifidobacterium panos TaxID=2675321 RepID=A0ABX1T107_9BIFI|nr:hypothetical protein [Bifidobacterium sp. DSM 109963]